MKIYKTKGILDEILNLSYLFYEETGRSPKEVYVNALNKERIIEEAEQYMIDSVGFTKREYLFGYLLKEDDKLKCNQVGFL